MPRLLALAVLLLALCPASATAQGSCAFQLGFKAIAVQVPEVVGRCLENEWFNTSNGNAEQRTTAHHGNGGLLVWRKCDNWTAFTDGHRTWVNGPVGLQQRLNTERFPWERDDCGTSRRDALVIRVVDGDTLDLSLGGVSERVRLIGIDTPETVAPGRPVDCYGPEATARARQLLEGQRVSVETDATQSLRDQYDRMLLHVFLPDGRLASEVLIGEGFAREYTYGVSYAYRDRLTAAQADAQAARRGLWDACSSGPTVAPVTPTAVALSPTPTPRPPTATPSRPPPSPACDASYPTVCIPPAPPDLDCGEIPFRRFPVVGRDPHRFDGDRDGIGCE